MRHNVPNARLAESAVTKLFVALLLYLCGTVLCFQFGPHVYGHSLGMLIWLYVFLFFAHAAIILGFIYEKSRPFRPSRSVVFIEKYIPFFPYAAFCAFIVELILRLSIYEGTFDSAEARGAWHDAGGSLTAHLVLMASSLTLPVIAVSFSRWHHFSIIQKGCLACCIGGEYLFTVMGGTRHGAFVVTLLILLMLLTKLGAQGRTFAKVFVLKVGVLFFAGFLIYSSIVSLQRYGFDARDITIEELARKQGRLGNVLDPDHPVVAAPIPNYIKPAVVSGMYYFGHGYGALAHAISLPQGMPSLGVGHSLFLVRNAYKFGFHNVADNSYIIRLNNEYGYMIPQTWMTGYTWYASDLTFYGVIPFLFFLTRLLCRAWRCYAYHSDLYASLALVWLFNIYIQLPLLFPGQDYVPLALIYSSLGLFIFRQRAA